MVGRSRDNFIDATLLCQSAGKEFKDYYRLKSTKDFLKSLRSILKSVKEIVQIVGGNGHTWVHPRVATDIAYWCSRHFGCLVTGWIEEWKSYAKVNEQLYMKELNGLVPSNCKLEEREIQVMLQGKNPGSETEVETPVGKIDLLTLDEIIEIKIMRKWKHAVGQILCYKTYYPTHGMRIYLFGNSKIDRDVIYSHCSTLRILVSFHVKEDEENILEDSSSDSADEYSDE